MKLIKTSLFAAVLAGLLSFGSAQAVTVTLAGIANTTVGLVTEGATNVLGTGTARFYSSSVDLGVSDLEGILAASDPLAFFESKISADPGAVRGPIAFTNGALSTTGPTELGAVANKTYLFLSTPGFVGVFQGTNVPSVGAVTFNPATVTQDLVGTSTLQSVSGTNSGFQLVAVVPEPSTALLGLLGIAGLIRRRR